MIEKTYIWVIMALEIIKYVFRLLKLYKTIWYTGAHKPQYLYKKILYEIYTDYHSYGK